MNSAFDLTGRVAVITGGNGGIGLGMAEGLARAGASVMIAARDTRKSEAALARLQGNAGQFGAIEVDVLRKDSIERMLAETARRECQEEIGVTPSALVELFSYLPTPGLTDEEVTFFVAAVDASRVPARTHPTEGEYISVTRVPIDEALAALGEGKMHNGPLVVGLLWLALNRGRVAELLGAAR